MGKQKEKGTPKLMGEKKKKSRLKMRLKHYFHLRNIHPSILASDFIRPMYKDILMKGLKADYLNKGLNLHCSRQFSLGNSGEVLIHVHVKSMLKSNLTNTTIFKKMVDDVSCIKEVDLHWVDHTFF